MPWHVSFPEERSMRSVDNRTDGQMHCANEFMDSAGPAEQWDHTKAYI